LNNKVSQNDVATCLRHGGIFNHQFIANSALSPVVKVLEIDQHLAKL